jgi:AraC-like DNA-binding protein/quercetin dioxygenase-like cupin family protein
MKALQKSPISPDRAFEYDFLKAPHFDHNWHFHSEYQLFIVLRGTGTRFIGDHVQSFRPGDLVLTGPDLPHLWRSDPEYFEGDSLLRTEGIVIYFPEDFFRNPFLEKLEMYSVRQLLAKAARGVSFTGAAAEKVGGMMKELREKKDFDGILQLLKILQVLAGTDAFQLLANPGYSNSLKQSDTERMNQVHAHVMKNFREKITLEEVAAIANMTPSSFSRYFKMHANKTFSEFLTGIRIGYACKLIIEKKINITQACYDSGFNTLSNFNRQFKDLTGFTPLEYRNRYLGRGS